MFLFYYYALLMRCEYGVLGDLMFLHIMQALYAHKI